MTNKKPTEIDSSISWFDKFASWASGIASKAPFFAFCVLLIVIWAPTILIMPFDTSQLLINTATTIITFLMVALLQNSQWRGDTANSKKLDAIADGLADFMENMASNSMTPNQQKEMLRDVDELRAAVGLEKRISSKKDS
jgi:low affinity Fe/Cu permease